MNRTFDSIDRTAEELRPNYQADLQKEKRRQAAQKALSKSLPPRGHLHIDSRSQAYADAAK